MSWKYYIASRLENAEEVKTLKKALDNRGWQHTYDWTTHGSVQAPRGKMRQIADDEAEGVYKADVVIVLLPGGRGTHAELGMGISLGKEVFILSQDVEADFGTSGRTCAFYHHSQVTQCSSWADLMCELLDYECA